MNKLDTLTAGAGITVSGTGSSRTVSSNLVSINLVAPLSGSTSGTSVTIESLWKPSTVTCGAGLFCLASDTLGTLQLSLTGSGGAGQTEAEVKALIANNVTSNDALGRLDVLSSTVNGTVAFAIQDAWANSKQDVLSTYTESVGSLVYLVSTDEANSVYFPFQGGTYTNTSTHTTVTLSGSNAGLYTTFLNPPTTGIWNVEVELQSGTTNEMLFTAFHGAWSNVQYIVFTGLTTSWQTFTWTFNALPGGTLYMNFGYDGQVPVTQPAGTVLWKNWRIYQSPATCTISAPLTAGPITSSGVISAVSYTSTSDRSIKENIQDANLDTVQGVFDAIEVKQYERIDVPGKRLGYIADDFAAALPEEYGNIVQMIYSSGNPLLSLDYSRASCILWGVCKNQQAALAALTARVAALESA